MARKFRKLAHCTSDELNELRSLRVKIAVLSFMLECAIRYLNCAQTIVCKQELIDVKNLYEEKLESIFARTGNYPSGGQLEVFRSGDIIEYLEVEK